MRGFSVDAEDNPLEQACGRFAVDSRRPPDDHKIRSFLWLLSSMEIPKAV